MEEKINLTNINKSLNQAISQYDFDLMIQCVKNGSKLDHMVLHRIINHDRVDLLDYLLFSTDLSEHFPLHYNYTLFGKQPALIYACSCGSIKILNYLLNNINIEQSFEAFDFKNISQLALINACLIGSIECVDLLLSHQKTKNYCGLDFENFKAITALDNRVINKKALHPELIQHLVLTQNINLVKQMEPYIFNLKDTYQKNFLVRTLNDNLIENKIKINKIKI